MHSHRHITDLHTYQAHICTHIRHIRTHTRTYMHSHTRNLHKNQATAQKLGISMVLMRGDRKNQPPFIYIKKGTPKKIPNKTIMYYTISGVQQVVANNSSNYYIYGGSSKELWGEFQNSLYNIEHERCNRVIQTMYHIFQ